MEEEGSLKRPWECMTAVMVAKKTKNTLKIKKK